MSIVTALLAAAGENRAGIRFVQPGGMENYLSYRDVYERAISLLGCMQERGVQPGNEVIIQTEDNQLLICLFWACVLGGIIPVPLSSGAQAGQKQKVAQVWQRLLHPFLIGDEQHIAAIQPLLPKPKNNHAAEVDRIIPVPVLLETNNTGIPQEVKVSSLAYIQFSSGSTGDPKGVCLTHANLLANVSDIIKSLAITNADTLLSWMPLTHDMGMIGFHLAGVIKNINIVAIPTSVFIRRPMLWMHTVTTHRASVLYSPNFGFQYFLSAYDKKQQFDWDLSCVRIIVNGAETISADLCRGFIQKLKPYGLHDHCIVAAYGLAEATLEVSAMPVATSLKSYFLNRKKLNIGDVIEMVPEKDNVAVEFVDVGYPVSSCRVRICNEKDMEVAGQAIGHIQINGESVTSGYYNDPIKTESLFTSDHWLRTGDVGFLCDNRLVITGRSKNIIIINGQNYYPHDIERVIINAGIAEIGKVVACGMRQMGREQLLVFILDKGNAVKFAPVIKSVKEVVLNQIGIPVYDVIAVRQIPKTTSGKIQYYLLVQQYVDGEFKTAIEGLSQTPSVDLAPAAWQNDAETVLVTMVRSVLSNEIPDIYANFFDYGLNSLTVLQLTGKLNLLTGRQLSPEVIFAHATVQALSRYILYEGIEENTTRYVWQQLAPVRDVTLPQQRMWAECQLNKNSVAFNLPLVYRVTGACKPGLLEASVRVLVEKYEILRTAFVQEGDGIVRQGYPFSTELFQLKQTDLRLVANYDKEAAALCTAFVNEPFSLENPTQLRMQVIMLPDAFIIVFVIHHILIDGSSLALLLQELNEIYNSLEAGKSFNRQSPAITFDHYTAWQKHLMTSDVFNVDRHYWLQELQDSPQPVGLSLNHGISQPGDIIPLQSITHVFGPEQVALVRSLAKQFETTPFSVWMALLNVLVYRYVQKKDIVIGFDVSGRITPEMASVLGYTLNTLCLRILLDGNMTFAELMAIVKKKLSAAIEHQLYPFERLLEEKIDKSVAGNSLFNMLVLYQNYSGHNTELNLSGCQSKREQYNVQHGFVDLLFEFSEKGNTLELVIQYNERLYEQADMEQVNAHLTNLLQAVAQPNLAIGMYEFLTGKERAYLFPHYSRYIDVMHVKLPVHLLFEKMAASSPESIAVVAGNKGLTYKQLNERANSIAHFLSKTAIEPDARIGFIVNRNENIIIAILAILKTGGAYVAIDPELSPIRYARIMADSGVKYLLVDDDNWDVVSQIFGEAFLINIDEKQRFVEGRENPVFKGTLNDLAYVIYTSGSTGDPKGVMIEHKTLTNYVRYFIQYFNVTGQDIFLQQSSVAFDTLVEELFPALCTAGKIVIAQNGGRNIDELLDLVVKNRVTIISCTPLVLNEINNRVNSRIASLRVVISGGDVLYPAQIDKLLCNVPVYNTYGPCETTVCATYKPVRVLQEASLIGRPLGDYWVYILDENLQMMPWGKTGEIFIEGGLARGYLNQPALTKEKFIANPFDRSKRLYRSGDMGRITESGDIEFAGRTDYQVKVRGYRIELAEIEKNILDFPSVKNAAVVPNSKGDQLVAFLIVRDGYTDAGLRQHIGNRVPAYMIPHRFEVVEKLPMTTTGKIDRKVLSTYLQNIITGQQDYVAPMNKLEKGLVEIIKQVLQVDRVGMTDNLFVLGCTSINATQIAGHIYKQLGCKIEMRSVFIYPTAALLAEQIRGMAGSLYASISVAGKKPFYMLSPGQERLWLINKIEENSYAYNESVVYEMNGHIEVELIKKIFGILSERHAILRTTFDEVNDEPVQIIHEVAGFPVDFSVRECSHGTGSQHIEELLQSYTRKPFNMEVGPLYRVILVRLSPNKCLLVVVMHHIITDDRSYDILIKEFVVLYNCIKDNQQEWPAKPLLQYTDYATWIREPKAREKVNKHLLYWREALKDEIPVLDLPADFKRPAVKRYEGSSIHYSFDALMVDSIKTFCKENNVSLFMLLASAAGILLARYTDQYDMVIGTPLTERNHPDLEDVPGFFINTIPLRLRFDASDNLSGLLATVKAICLAAYEHAECSFEHIVTTFNLKRDLSRSPLFDVLINLSERVGDPDRLDLEDLVLTKYYKKSHSCKYDLAFYFEENKNGLLCTIEYDTAIYSQSRIVGMATHFTNIIKCFITNVATQVSEIDMLSPAERWQVLQQFNKPQQAKITCTVIDLFLEIVKRYGDKIAIIYKEKKVSYDEVNCQSDIMANNIIAHYGIKKNDRVCVIFERSENIVIAILAIWKAGATYVPIDPQYPIERIAYLLNDTRASLLITDNPELGMQQELSGLPCYFMLCLRKANPFLVANELIQMPLPPADIAYVLYTSGSTGEPKGVEVYHSALANVLVSLQAAPGIIPEDILLSVSNCTFDISIAEYFIPLITGAQLVLASREQVMDVTLLKKLFENFSPTYMQATPALWNALIETGWQGCLDLKAISCGEPLTYHLKQQLLGRTGRLWNMYGPTETTIFSTIEEMHQKEEVISIGAAIRNTTLYILDRFGQPVPPGVDGELHIGGAGLARGYLNRPELTAKKFIEPSAIIPERIYATGDIGRWLSNGTIVLKGRNDSQVKVRGIRIEPGEIENVMLGYADIQSVAVCRQTDSNGDTMLVAFIEYKASHAANDGALRTYLRRRLPAYMIPGLFVEIKEMPFNNSGKIDRKKLMAGIVHSPVGTEKSIVPPVTETQVMLLKIWRMILNRDEICITDSFFDIGGHSLKANKMVNLIYRDMGVTVKLSDIFTHSTLKDLGELIATHQNNEYDYIELS